MSERMGGFESERPQFFRESSSGNLERVMREYLRLPEGEEELLSFFEYMVELARFVRTYYPPAQQAEMFRRLHLEITVPQIAAAIPSVEGPTERRPSTSIRGLPTTPRTIPVGDHMDVTLGLTSGSQWPDSSRPTLVLTDGFIVHPQTPVGIIDFYRNIARLGNSGNLMELSRALISSAHQSLTTLAQGYERLRGNAGIEAPNVEGFSGMSHLARLAEKFGFTVFDIADGQQRERATETSFSIASGIAGGNQAWEALKAKYKPAKIALISGRELVRRFNK